MSEHEPKLEAHKQHEKLVDPEHQKHVEKAVHEKAEKAAQERSAENLKLLHEMAREQAETRRNTPIEHVTDKEPDTQLDPQSMKSNAYDRTLRRVQQKLPKQAQLFSQAVHNKTVEAISETTAKTIARPSGLLGGSICAFIGSLLLLYYSKHYGFKYNYLFFLILFIGGFLIGAILELAIWTLHKRKHGHY